MSALELMLSEFAELYGAGAAASPGAAARSVAAQTLRVHALPTRREENWRYTDLRPLEKVRSFLPAAPAAAAADPAALPPALPGFTRLVFVDGRLQAGFPLPDAALVTRLRPGFSFDAGASGPFETSGDGRLGLIAGMFAPEPLSLRISGTIAIEFISIATVAAGATYTDLALQLAPGAKLELVERHLASAGPAAATATPVSSRLRVQLETESHLMHTRLQQMGADALYYDTVSASLGERASYNLRQVVAGTGNARSSTQVRLRGRDATLQIRSLAAANGSQVVDSLYTVLHEAPGTRSDQLFRGIASDRARVACSADVQVTPGAPGSRVKQSLRGLIDGEGAEVDLRPRLTIDTDDIQAAHGATTGRLNDDLMFYLLSRGLAPETARSLLRWAFLSETLSAIEPQALRRVAELAVAARLTDAPAAELLQ